MARDFLGFGLPQANLAPQQDPRARIEALASQHQVPANVLLALQEAGADVDAEAPRLGQTLQSGVALDAALAASVKDPARASQLLNRAYDIADEIYPRQAAPAAAKTEPGFLGDAGRMIGGALVRGAGGAIKGLGLAAEELATGGRQSPNLTGPTLGRRLADKAATAVSGWGEAIQGGVSQATKDAMANSTPDGNILQPSTWTVGKDPSLRGYAMLAADVFGSALPVVATAIATRSPAATAAAGGLMEGGAGAAEARQTIEGMANAAGPDGQPLIAKESAYYRELRAIGMDHAQAVETTAQAAERIAGLQAGAVGAVGGAATERILGPVARGLAGRGIAARTAGVAGLSAIEEGAQEAAAGIATRSGVNQGAGTNIDVMEGTFGEAALGALGGAPFGAGAGALSRREQQNPGADGSGVGVNGAAPGVQPTDAGAAPAPTPQQPAPVTPQPGAAPAAAPPANGAEKNRALNSLFEFGQSAQGVQFEAESPEAFQMDDLIGIALRAGATPDEVDAALSGQPPEAMGPIASAAAAAPDLTPVPEVEPIQRFPDQKPGAQVRLADPEGKVWDGVFLRETPDGVVFRIAGAELTLTPAEFDEAISMARAADADAKAKATGKPAQTAPVANVAPARPPVASGGLAAQATPAPANSSTGLPEAFGAMGKAMGENYVDMVFDYYSRGKDTDASGARNNAIVVAKRIAAAGGAVTRENMRAIIERVDQAMAMPQDQRQIAMAVVVSMFAPALRPKPKKGTPDATAPTQPPAVAPAIPAQPAATGAGGVSVAPLGGGVPNGSAGPQQPAVEGGIRPARAPAGPAVSQAAPDAAGQPVAGVELTGPISEADAFEAAAAANTKEGIANAARRGDGTTNSGAEGTARPVKTPAIQGLAERDGSVPQSELSVLPQLRGARDNAPPPTDEFSAISASRGRKTDAAASTRQDQQRSGLPAGESSLGNQESAVAQYAQEPDADGGGGDPAAGGMGRAGQSGPGNDPLSPEQRDVGSRSGSDASEDKRQAVKPTITDIREKASVLRGVPKDQAPKINDVSLRWSDQEGGFVFSRKHKDKVQAALDGTKGTKAPEPNKPGEMTVTNLVGGKTSTIVVDPLGPLYPGYTRVMVDGKGTTDQTRVTGDGYVITRKINKTEIVDPAGKLIWTGAYDARDSVINAEIDKIRSGTGDAPTPKPVAKPTPQIAPLAGMTPLGATPAPVAPATPAPSARAADGWWNALTVDQRTTSLGEAGFLGREWSDLSAADRVEIYEQTAESVQLQSQPAIRKPAAPPPITTKPAQNIPENITTPEPAVEKPVVSAPKPINGLTDAEAARMAELQARFLAKMKNQTNAGLDPEMVAIAFEMAGLYVKAGVRRFRALIDSMMSDMGLTLEQAQPYARNAYASIRGDLDLAGEDVADMDSDEDVIKEVRKMRAAEAKKPEPVSQDSWKPATIAASDAAGGRDGTEDSTDSGEVGQDGEPGPDGPGGAAGEPAGNADSGSMERAAPGPDAGNAAVGRAGSPRPRRRRPAGDGNLDLFAGGDEPRGGDGAGVAGVGDARPGRDEPEGTGRSNYRITDPEALFAGGPKARFAKNRAAMEAFQRVTDEQREPTPEELDAMAAFIGWGSFGQELFQGTWDYPRPKDDWKDQSAWLRDHLGKEAWISAQESIINAHYTDPPTVQAMWKAIQAMGFKGGRILEPAMGIGNFFGMMPADIAAASQLTGIELEKTTGAMAKMLYPRANVQIMGYEKSKVPDGFYDLVIGNWPFANIKVADRRYDRLSPSLHDYFFVKALDQVRAGGLVVGITSAFTMDGQKNRGIRQHLAQNAELVGAFRLPSGAFEKYAGTKVVTDIIILRKREAPVLDVSGEAWVKSSQWNGEDFNVNDYFQQNPGNVLGELTKGSGTTYGKAGMIVNRPANIGELLEGLADRLPKDAYKPVRRGSEPRFTATIGKDRIYSVTVTPDGKVFQVMGDQMAPIEDVVKIATKNPAETKKRMDSLRALVEIRKSAESVMAADREGASDADAKRKALKKAYTAFVKEHGKIADSFALKTMVKLRDPNAGMAAAMETRTGEPSTLMERSTVRAIRKLDKPTIRDAFVLARNETVALDLDRVAELAGKPRDEVVADLTAGKAIYRVPGGAYEAADLYLSGNVRQKLREARDALAYGEDMQASVDALVAVQPPDIPYFQIEARFGADWVGADINRQFIIDTLQLTSAGPEDVVLVRGVTGWRVDLSESVSRMRGVSDITGAPTPGTRGTGLSLRRFLEATLNTQTITVTAADEDSTYKDTKATEQANQKAADLRQKFGAWLWQDPERRAEMEVAYNEAMNAVATPVVDGSFLEFPGMALQRGDDPFSLRKHQSDAIWRGILNQRGIYGHQVGTGKTITMTGIAVESRRYGLAKKPLLIAHNANSAAVATEAQDTYPGAKILYINNLAAADIGPQMARIATEDWDMVVIPHSLLDRMALSRDTLMALAAEDIAAYEREAIEAAEAEGHTLSVDDLDDEDKLKKMRLPVTAKEMVKARQRLLQAIEKQAQRASREGAITFENLGVDMILVDESHEFKKPPLATRMQVKGLNTGTSNKSLALRFLTSYVKSIRGGTGVHVFTGTPITNTLAEIYHQMYYAMDDVMRQNRVDTWDGFFKTFADTIADVELTATGDFENVERLAAFINVSELRRMAGQFLDIVFANDMPEFRPRDTADGKNLQSPDLTEADLDFLRNGRTEKPVGRPYKKVIHDIGPMGVDQRRILNEVKYYAQQFKEADGKTRMAIMRGGGPNAPIVYNNVPNRASMDARLHEPDAEDQADSKANRAVRNIARIYLDEPMAAQVLFMDEGYSSETTSVRSNGDGTKTKTKKVKLNLAADIVNKLVALGVKREEIAIVAGGVTAEEKKAIADAMNNRKTRIVIGQTKTLGVGVNMQKYLRAMHHLDAPWMPGDLEQRNGRGERQGNTWNTVLEYRYLTEGLDGRRWQVLAIKDRFIKSFLKAKEGQRVIEGDAVDDAETMDGSSLAETLSEAAGDPRLQQITKLNKGIERLRVRESIHSAGIADAIRRIKQIGDRTARIMEDMPPMRDDAAHVTALREKGEFAATIDAKTYDARPEAAEAMKIFLTRELSAMRRGDTRTLSVDVNGFGLKVRRGWTQDPMEGNTLTIMRKGEYDIGSPSLPSMENGIRRVIERLESRESELADLSVQAQRLERAKVEPFQQSAELERKIAQKAAIERDLEVNPVPAPAWLRQGAPTDSVIYVDRQERIVTGHRWNAQGWFVVTEQGDVPYMEAKNETGVPLYDEREFEKPEVSEGSKLRDGSKPQEKTDDKESRFARPATPADIRSVMLAVNAEVANLGLAGKVTANVVRGLIGMTGQPIAGRQRGALIEVNTGSGDVIGTARHEIIHALRDEGLWRQPFGLFSADEWRALVKAARADKDLMAEVDRAYPDLNTAGRVEEAVAELYRRWAADRDTKTLAGRAMEKMRAFFRAMASALRGEGFSDAAIVMERIARGDVGGRGPDGPRGGIPQQIAPALADMTGDKELRLDMLKRTTLPTGSSRWRADKKKFWSDLLTQSMVGKDKGRYSALALVPGRALFGELGKNLLAAKAYLRGKEDMDALRNDWHVRADTVAQEWRTLQRKDPRANEALMDLMHDTTLDGLDPSKPDLWRHALGLAAERAVSRDGDAAPDWAKDTMAQIRSRKGNYDRLVVRFNALPDAFQAMYRKVRNEYDTLGEVFERTVIENIETATRIAIKRAERAYRKELRRITDEGLEGDEKQAAIDAAEGKWASMRQRGGWGAKARMAQLRQSFESNKKKGPYFPLARFGDLFVTVRDEKGAVTSFSRFESAREQREWASEAEKTSPGRVTMGTMSNKDELKGSGDPNFTADVQSILQDAGASPEVMDAVWQKWLETLPDMSIRTNRIHRKGRAGYHRDAFRAFGKQMFHGAHQLARLKYGLTLEEHLNDAEEEARRAADPVRAGLVVNEMRQRHQFAMNPAGSALLAGASSLAFIWYLGLSPAAAAVNIFQTTVLAPGVFAAKFQTQGVSGAIRELTQATIDFGRGRFNIEKSDRLTDDEQRAVAAAERRGVTTKTQAHDLASVQESGIEYNAAREKVMRVIGYMFHHTERANREVTFLAGYRMGRKEGLAHDDAVNAAADMTYTVHFDYQNTARPRFMQGDIGRALTMFKQFTVNMLWRMFRDAHQTFAGATKEERREARVQLVGITLSMMAHAGIKGTWGYALLMMLLALFLPGDSDDLEDAIQDALLIEGDTPATAAWNWMMGAALNGVPGQVTGLALSERIGMPTMWFRGQDRDMEGEDLYAAYVTEALGPVYGIGESIVRGASMVYNGDVQRGIETMIPKWARDPMKAYRYATEGAETMKGDPIMESMSPWQVVAQFNGFTSAQLAERYKINNRLKNQEGRIMDERSSIHRAIGDAIMAGDPIPQSVMDDLNEFNKSYPEYPITKKTINLSIKGRQRSSARNEFGIQINPKLNDRLRADQPQPIYQGD